MTPPHPSAWRREAPTSNGFYWVNTCGSPEPAEFVDGWLIMLGITEHQGTRDVLWGPRIDPPPPPTEEPDDARD